MDWISTFQLFLFDFDGLLVNTEEIHYLAYKKMCADRKIEFTWNFEAYCRVAHYSAEGLREQIYADYPNLKAMEPNWDVLYAEKKQAVTELLKSGAIHLMPGVQELLLALNQAKIPRCVVTNSSAELVSIVREKNPVLNTIPTWFTREYYSHPKPHPEGYLKAIKELAKEGDSIIGFEDTPRGLEALSATPAKPILISQICYPEISDLLARGITYFPTFLNIPKNFK